MDTDTILLIVLVSLLALEKIVKTIVDALQPSSPGGSKITLTEILQGILGVFFTIWETVTGKPVAVPEEVLIGGNGQDTAPEVQE
jgi:hypothetical protein